MSLSRRAMRVARTQQRVLVEGEEPERPEGDFGVITNREAFSEPRIFPYEALSKVSSPIKGFYGLDERTAARCKRVRMCICRDFGATDRRGYLVEIASDMGNMHFARIARTFVISASDIL